ncbi:MAG TPA: glycosyltransferase [Elusimicrobiota bacterium]|nr:glycosyltransferase [Elusimicrobiota bacterium]
MIVSPADRRTPDVLRKSPALLVSILILWGILLSVYGAAFPGFLPGRPVLNAFLVLQGFCAIALSLSLSRMIVSMVFTGLSSINPIDRTGSALGSPRVAVLYATCNDFCEPAIESCLKLDHGDCHVFVLDDSDDDACRERVDRFVGGHSIQVALIRRGTREGFKSGNYNHALRLIQDRFDYFVMVDSDNVVPSDLISVALPYFQSSGQVGFVSCNQVGYGMGDHPVGVAVGDCFGFSQDVFSSLKNRYGHVPSYGHNVMVRMETWRKIGGFVEGYLSEDNVFSLQARSAGYVGVFVKECYGRDAVPEDLASVRRANSRWTCGNLQFLFYYYLKNIRDRTVPWLEKVDIFLGSFTFAVPWTHLFLLLLMLQDGLHYGLRRENMSGGAEWVGWFRLNLVVSGSLAIVTILLAGGLMAQQRRPDRASPFRFIVSGTYFYVSFLTKNVIDYLFGLRPPSAHFWVPLRDATAGKREARVFENVAEGVLSLVLMAVGVWMRSLWMVVIGAVSMMTLASLRRSREGFFPLMTRLTFVGTVTAGVLTVYRFFFGGY